MRIGGEGGVSKGRSIRALVSLAAAFLLVSAPAAESPAGTHEQGVSPRIVNGKTTTIEQWPWQVALLDRTYSANPRPTTRYRCSGVLVAPDLVATAGHCVAEYRLADLSNLSVLTGRTFLDQAGTGQRIGVDRILMPRNADGSRKYRAWGGSADWDVALLELESPSSSPAIRIAGATETGAWRPGRPVWTMGWGYVDARRPVSNVLRAAAQVILPDRVCRTANGRAYRTKTMICLGGPAGHSSACVGDSGGPLVSRTSEGWRLIGLTSFGDFFCRGNVPSVDNRTAGWAVRSWIRETALERSGVDPIGSGGTLGPRPEWCRVPNLYRRTRLAAATTLRSRGCRLEVVGNRRKGRIVGTSLPPGWLAPPGFGIRVRLSR